MYWHFDDCQENLHISWRRKHKQETLVKKLLNRSYNAHDAQEDVNLLFELFTKKLDTYGVEDMYAFNYHSVLNTYK